jgi:hypothetical protein
LIPFFGVVVVLHQVQRPVFLNIFFSLSRDMTLGYSHVKVDWLVTAKVDNGNSD